MAAPTNALVQAGVYWKIYYANRNVSTTFLLLMATLGISTNVHPNHIVMLHFVYQLTSQLERRATKWDSKAFSITEDVVSDTVDLNNWKSSYLNLLRNSVNVSSPADIDTALAVTPTPIHLDPMAGSALVSLICA